MRDLGSLCMLAVMLVAGCGASDQLAVTQRLDIGEELAFQRQFAMPRIIWYYAEDEEGNGVGVGYWDGLPLPGYKPTPGIGVTILPETATAVIWTRRGDDRPRADAFAFPYGPCVYLTTDPEGITIDRLGTRGMKVRFELFQMQGGCPEWQGLLTDCDVRGVAEIPSPPRERDVLYEALGGMELTIKKAGLDPFETAQTLKYPLARDVRTLLFARNLRKALETMVPLHDWRVQAE